MNSADMSEKVDDGSEDKAQGHHTAEDIPAEDRAVTRAACDVDKVQPQLPLNMETRIIYEVNQSFTSKGKSQISVQGEAGEDVCAAILLACLFCHPLDCLLATMRGCNECVWSLCSYVCGCTPASLQPLHICDMCGGVGVRCLLCDCPLSDVCIQATECLDLAMEISQMLFHN